MESTQDKRPKRRKGTQTSAFGSPGRIGHDSSRFYQSKLYADRNGSKPPPFVENQVPPALLNTILCKSSERMEELPDNSVHLMVTSPPYNVGKEYDQDLSLDEYRQFLKRVWAEVFRVLVPGGRACINVANLGRRPYIPLHRYIIEDALEVGFLMRGEIIWDKGSSASRSTAWGSWRSAANPTLRDTHEYILVFCKDSFGRMASPSTLPFDYAQDKLRTSQERSSPSGALRTSTITKEEFLEYTRSVWHFPAESAKKVGHPAPFPVELPRRLIQLYTFADEVVLDPFVGSGATCIAALKVGKDDEANKRNYVAYEIEEKYKKLAERRIEDSKKLWHQENLVASKELRQTRWDSLL